MLLMHQYCPLREICPFLRPVKLKWLPKHMKSKQAWLESLSTIDDVKLGIVDLHPEIFATTPRIDMLWQNVQWQMRYRKCGLQKSIKSCRNER
eukprot:UN01031